MAAWKITSPRYATGRVGRGRYFVAGIAPGLVTVDGAPASRTVLCYDAAQHHLVAKTTSASDGTYRIEHLDGTRKYRLVAVDDLGEHNAVVADRITPVPMDS
ncbi:hypothetical protein [Sinimarinibacterium flocculans]|uniref:hypothetical protein n=1 Tax=Sinimarinibacterium flocculans TaxID=985250 RepID=UPI003C742A45